MKKATLSQDIIEIVDDLGDTVQRFAGKTVLITGATGFLGRYFVQVFARLNESVLKTPCRIIALDNLLTSKRPEAPLGKEIEFVEHDIIQPWAPTGKLDYIIHAAGIASPHYYREYPLETLEVAVSGTKNMLELAKRTGAKITFFSSSEIYGNPDPQHVPTSEEYYGYVSCYGPRACYDESKRLGETLCMIYNTRYGVHTNVIRPFNVFGPGMTKTDYRVLPNFAAKILADEPVIVYGNGKQTRTFCYITDAMKGFFRVVALGGSGETYNIGNPDPEIGIAGLVLYIEKILGKKVRMELQDYPATYPGDEPQRRCPSIKKAQSQVGYSPRVDLETGLKRFLDWARENFE